MKPMIKYRGGKSKEIPFIVPYIPQYTGSYIEPFLGGGAVYFYLELQHAIVNDINKKLMDFYIGVQQDYLDLSEELSRLEEIYNANRTEFEAITISYQ